ncbi:MAG: chromosome segregation protein SMC [Armatimonadetes bacterium]|nr:chromosome segregation protein SMC [Armatimonadota bacterium]
MHLKKLQLLGFKSFADETTLEFGPGITAVVGPNGSGKSNIVDAMLWTLGERSAKALRGHGATDVIFNGAASRKPTGLCEVSLFFDNQSGTLPIHFEEVQVTRRLFRDGAGEYAIGGSKCRLRDVTDLFLDTGVGPDAGCIISQGEIDAILSAKPEDRRGLIEGAAGIQKYHARRTETRRRLEKVVVDLIRVGDITSELEAQLEPLAGQAHLAREYDSLVSRLKELQLAVLARDYQNRVVRFAAYQEGQAASTVKVREGRIEIERLERLESITSRQMRELEGRVETLSRDLTEAVSRLKGAEGQLAVARERRRALTESQEFQAREIGHLRARIAATGEQIEATKSQLLSAQHENSGLNQAAAQAEGRLGEANAKLSEATRELQTVQAQVIEAMRAGQKRRETLAGGKAEIAALENRVFDLERLLGEGQSEGETLEILQSEAQELLAHLRAKLADDASLQTARQNLELARHNLQNASQNQNQLRENRARVQSRAGALRELEDSLEGFQGGTRAILQAVQRGQLRDDYIPVADAIRAPAHLELAIEVALGGNVNNLICADNERAKIGIEWLKGNRAGRATFLPLGAMRPSYLNDRTLDVLNDRAVLGLANELVECKREHESAVDHLLSRFIVVETLEDAIRLSKKCESGARLVSLEGEVVLPAGAITGGQGRQKSSGLLARKRELDEIEAKIAAIEGEIERSGARITAAQKAVAEAENALKSAVEAHNETRNQIARQEREVETVSRDLHRNKSQREAVESQIRLSKANLETKLAAQNNSDALAGNDEERARVLEVAVEGARAVAAQRQAEKDAVAGEVAEVRAQFGATLERLHAMRRSLAELENSARDGEAQIRAKELQIDRAAGEDAQIVAGEAHLIASLEELAERRADLDSSLETARLERGAALEKLNVTAIELKAARETLHGAEDELHRFEVRIASTQAEMADMERRFREEFELDPEAVLASLEAETATETSPAPSFVRRGDDIATPTNSAEVDEIARSTLLLTKEGAGEVSAPFNRRAALEEIEMLSAQIGDLGAVNLGAVAQYESVKERLDFLSEQKTDLEVSKGELDAIIAEIDGRMREQFMTTFDALKIAFDEIFVKVFDGGRTHLGLTEPDNLLETGIDLRVQMPGKAAQDISLLSGGERALTALSFLMAILRVRPAPFVILDEVDAPLDQSNVGRFTDLLREFTHDTQFIVITHNNGTMQAADVLYGVTQQEAGVSTLMSVRLAAEEELEGNRRVAAV